MLLYEESLRIGSPTDRSSRAQLATELQRAFRMMAAIVPSEAFFALRFAIDDICNLNRRRDLAEDLLQSLEKIGISVRSEMAIKFFPGKIFDGAYGRGRVFQTNADEEMNKLSKSEKALLAGYWQMRSAMLLNDEEFRERFGPIMA